MTTKTSSEVRIYGKNLRNPRKGGSYWTDISSWKSERFQKTGRFPRTVNVTTKSTESWSRNLSPIRIGTVATYEENGSTLVATSVEVAWQTWITPGVMDFC